MITSSLNNIFNNIKVSYYDEISPAILNNYYSHKIDTDLVNWKIIRPILKASYTCNFKDLINFIEIYVEPKTYILENEIIKPYSYYKIEYSLDYSNWYELPYKEDTYGDLYVFVSESVSGKIYKNLKDDTLITETPGLLNYVFYKYNKITKENESLYNNLFLKYIRITFFDITGTKDYPFTLKNIKIQSNEVVKYDSSKILSGTSSRLYPQKYFETYDFFPDIIKNFSRMLEKNNSIDLNYNTDISSEIEIKELIITEQEFDFYPIGIAVVGFNNIVR